MILDTSAVIALLLREPGWPQLEAALLTADRPRLPAPAYVECCLVMGGRAREEGVARVDEFLATYGVSILPFTPEHARLARDAFLSFGKGRHPAALNFGDCMSYAVARAEGLPLLFVGEDFARTDIPRA